MAGRSWERGVAGPDRLLLKAEALGAWGPLTVPLDHHTQLRDPGRSPRIEEDE